MTSLESREISARHFSVPDYGQSFHNPVREELPTIRNLPKTRHSRSAPMPFAQIPPNPVTQLKMSLFLGDVLGRLTDFRWNPTWERDRANSVSPRRRVLLP